MLDGEPALNRTVPSFRERLIGHLKIARVDHWVKNVFVLPGIVVALSFSRTVPTASIAWPVVLGLIATCLVASSNYVINEVLDAPYDATHPSKRFRPVPAGQVNVPLAYLQWIALGVVGVALGAKVATPLAWTLAALWGMGCVYNIPPVRSKEIPYLDVVSEAINNPLRMLAGWYMVMPAIAPPGSLLVAYWMVGCYFMAIKRYSELRYLLDPAQAVAYRKSFGYYTTDRLLVSILFYASAAMLCFGAFIIRYRAELLLAFPLVALVMALYLQVGFNEEGAAQAPEKLYREPGLVLSVVVCAVTMAMLMFVDVPAIQLLIAPTVPAALQNGSRR
jgi:4-hydroxybenzoate polyprenyltransferase